MLLRSLCILLIFLFPFSAYAANCLSVFPDENTVGGSSLTLPTFLVSDESDGDQIGSSVSLGAGQYEDIEADLNGSVTFTEQNVEYRMTTLSIGQNGELYMVAGDYYIDSLTLGEDSQLFISGSGTVRIYANQITFSEEALVNDAGGELIMMSYGDVTATTSTGIRYTGLLYAVDDISFGSSLDLYGALAAGNSITLTSPEVEEYTQSDVTVLEFDGVCTNATEGDQLIGFYPFEDSSFATDVDDDSGNSNHGSNINGAILIDGKFCQAFDSNGSNSDSSTDNAFNTNLDVNDDVGNEGSVSFWFKSDTDWDAGGDRTLFDASTTDDGEKYFYLELQSNGQLRVKLEDSNDDDFTVDESTATTRYASRWYYISVNWDLPRGLIEIFIDGERVSLGEITPDDSFGGLDSLVFGDNSSTYLDASPTSAKGAFDEIRVYDQVRSFTEINADMNDSSCAVTEVYFAFNEGTGQSVADLSGNARDGTLGTSSSSESEDPTWTCSSEGFHLDFDSSNNERVTTEAFTPPSVGAVSFWLKTSAIPSGTEYIFGFGDGWEARWESDGYIYFDINKQGTNTTIRTASTITDTDTWIHFTFLTDADTNDWSLYIDGVWNADGNETLTAESSAVLTIGGSTGQSDYFSGSIDDFRIYSGELTTDKITALATTAPAECAEEIAYFSFEQTDFSSEITDFSGNDNHGSNQGGVVTTEGKYCSAFDSNGDNNLSDSDNAFNSGIDVDAEIGLEGTVSFWFNSDISWGDSNEARNLFDAGTGDKYFFLQIRGSGKLAFKFENSDDNDFTVEESSVVARSADTWYYVTVTWNFTDDIFIIYVDGEIAVEKSEDADGISYDTDKNFPALGDLYFGDNAPSNVGDIDRSIDGQLDEVRIYDEVLSQARIQEAMNDSTCLGGVNHYQIEHDYFGITCDSENVVIRACSNEFDGTCTQSSVETTVTLEATGASDTQTDTITFTGSGTATIDYTTEEDVTFSLSSLSITPSEATVCNDDGDDSCVMAFSSAGFRFLYDNGGGASTVIDNQVAGEMFDLEIEGVIDQSGVCVSFLTDTKTLQISQENVNPSGTSGLSFQVENKNAAVITLDKYPTNTSDVILEFTDGKAPLTNAVYYDAGYIRLYAYISFGSFDIEGTSSAFWVAPYELQMAAKTSSSGTELNNTGATGLPTHEAGETFYLEVQALNAAGSVTQNYTPGDIELSLERTGPTTGGVEGVLSYASGTEITTALSGSTSWTEAPSFLSSFSNGVSTDSTLYYNEVGLIALDIQDVDYGGEGIVVNGDDTESDSDNDGELNIGRFTPDHFELTFGAVSNVITANESTYMGQPSLGFQYDIVPKNAIRIISGDSTSSGETLYNYIDDFAQSSPTLTFSAENNNDGTALDNRLTDSDFGGSWASSVYSNTDENSGFDLGTFDRDSATTVDGPFDNILYGINFTDADGITLDSLNENADKDMRSDTTGTCTNSDVVSTDCSAVLLTATESSMRYVRWVVENAYGPETADLPIPMKIEYWNGTEFVTDEDNNITTYDSTASEVTVTDIDLGSTPASSGNGTFVTGETDVGEHVLLSAPGAGNRGSVNVRYLVDDWFKFDWNDDGDYNDDEDDPSANATFGLYRGNDRIIYWREISN